MVSQNFKHNICEVIPWLRYDEELPVLERYFEQGQCTVYKVRLKTGLRLAIRVPLELDNGPEGPVQVVRQERHVLRLLAQKKFVWAPYFYGYSQSYNNPIQSPFIVVSWIKGTSLCWNSNTLPRPIQASILDQLAAIQRELVMLTCQDVSTAVTSHPTSPTVGKWPAFSYVSSSEVEGLEVRFEVLPVPKPEGEEEDPPELIALDHGDIQPYNIIVNRKYKIKGIVGWDSASLAPIAKANEVPAFLRESDMTFDDQEVIAAYQDYYSSPAASLDDSSSSHSQDGTAKC